MIRTRSALTTTVLALLIAGGAPTLAYGQDRSRAAIPDRYKWNLADLYASDEAWRAAKEGRACS